MWINALAPPGTNGGLAAEYFTNSTLAGAALTLAGVAVARAETVDLLLVLAADVPDDTKKKIDEIKAGLKAGSFAIWKGPIVDNTGKEVLAKDVVADDAWNSKVNFFLKGVEGKPPAK